MIALPGSNSESVLFQVNYFKDHTKLIVGGERSYTVTYINSERQGRTWHLMDMARRGAAPQVRNISVFWYFSIWIF